MPESYICLKRSLQPLPGECSMGTEDKCGSKDREGGDWEEGGDPGRESGGLIRDLFGGRAYRA